ncbi:MAG: nicotinate-nicotinamide nucleotide adenylyltransferase [Firmicutes bacterium]|nr:nicotinate-nicotinamide nucleotide adenylyltransferase [Bacillota bacterium]
MNIVYGGSFDPPTVAHAEILRRLEEAFHPARRIVVPTGDSYDWKEKTAFAHRFRMAQLAFPGCILSDVEQREGFHGTVDTLRILRSLYGEVHFCMGADNLLTLPQWKHADELVQENFFLVFARGGIDAEGFLRERLPEYRSHFQLLELQAPVSATAFRQTHDPRLVSPAVYAYAREHHLYGLGET